MFQVSRSLLNKTRNENRSNGDERVTAVCNVNIILILCIITFYVIKIQINKFIFNSINT